MWMPPDSCTMRKTVSIAASVLVQKVQSSLRDVREYVGDENGGCTEIG